MFRTYVLQNFRKLISLFGFAMLLPGFLMAQDVTNKPSESSFSNPFVLTAVFVMFVLLLFIGILANVVIGSAVYYRERQKAQEHQQKHDKDPTGNRVLGLIILLVSSISVNAQDITTVEKLNTNFGGISQTAFYFIIGTLSIELTVIFILLYQLRFFLRKEKLATESANVVAEKLKPQTSLWSRLNRFKPAEQEAEIDLGHDYDGIRELDNRLPPWWLYGFYITIVFAGIYLWRFHVSHTAPLSADEYQLAVKEAEIKKENYLKKAANLVDENSVKLLTDASALNNGKKLFDLNCAACHGKSGEGIVGPNLTDQYWMHGGGLPDIFKTIKYGWPEKGMKSWKDDFSPSQLAEITSYIKSLQGTNPPNAKEKQGELYTQDENINNEQKNDSTRNVKIVGVRM